MSLHITHLAPHVSRRLLQAVLVVVLAGAGWLGYQAFHIYDGMRKMTGVEVKRTRHEPKIAIPALDSRSRLNFLLLGSDNDQKKEEARPLTQSMIVVTVDPVHDKVGLLSIPRDFYVPIRGHGMAKIDLAHKYGGVALARETVERLFHIPIHYYAWVGLRGFIRVIDTFGGVSIDVTHPILDDSYPNDLGSPDPYATKRVFIPAGWQHVSGTEALEYVRSRHGDAIGDFGRSARQQQVLLALHREASALNVLTHLPALVDDLQGNVKTDLTVPQLYALAQLSRHIRRQDITQVVLQAPTYSHFAWTSDGQSIVVPDWRKIRPVIARMFAPVVQARPSALTGHATAIASPPSRPAAAPRARPTPTAPPSTSTSASLPGRVLVVQAGDIFEVLPGGSRKQLTWSGDGAMPSPSPDGRTVAFVRFTLGLQRYGKYASDVWLLDLPTGRQHVITHDESSLVANNLWASWPDYSPDGKQIVYSTDRAKLAQPPSDARFPDLGIWAMTPAGTGLRSLATPTSATAGGTGGYTTPAWYPGGRFVAYVRWAYGQPNNQPYSQLVLLDTRSGQQWPLTAPGDRVLQPRWSPSGGRLVYVRGEGDTSQIVVAAFHLSARGPRLGQTRVFAQGDVAQPAFSPDGRWVSYLRLDPAGASLYVVPAGGGASRAVPAAGSDLDARSRPVWLP